MSCLCFLCECTVIALGNILNYFEVNWKCHSSNCSAGRLAGFGRNGRCFSYKKAVTSSVYIVVICLQVGAPSLTKCVIVFVESLLRQSHGRVEEIARARGIKPVAENVKFPPVGPVFGTMLMDYPVDWASSMFMALKGRN